MAAEKITTISPITNKPVVERYGPTDEEMAELPRTAKKAYLKYRKTPLSGRQKIVKKALQLISNKQDELARELTEQMGRPIAYTAKEVSTAVARGEYMLKISDNALAATPGEAQDGFHREVRKESLGPVLVLFAWNVRSPHFTRLSFCWTDEGSSTRISSSSTRSFLLYWLEIVSF